MLAPIAMWFSWKRGRKYATTSRWTNFIPWFMQGFFLLAILRTTGILNEGLADQFREVGRIVTIASMGAIGLNVNLRELSKSGLKVVITVIASMAIMFGLALIALRFL